MWPAAWAAIAHGDVPPRMAGRGRGGMAGRRPRQGAVRDGPDKARPGREGV